MTTSTNASPPPLNLINYLNIIGYIINTFGTFLIGIFFDLPGNGTVSDKYQTLVTPAGWAFSIWGIIFLSQLVFVVAQSTTNFRSNRLVQKDGVGYWYFFACIAQTLWTPVFSYEKIILSAIIMTFILIPLVIIVTKEYQIISNSTSVEEFWLMRFPFNVHCGWISVAFVLNLGLALVASGMNSSVQYGFSIICIIYVIGLAIFCLFYVKRPNYTIVLVLVWATFAIAMELSNPKETILQTFTTTQIESVRITSLVVSISLTVTVLGRALYTSFLRRRSSGDDESSLIVGNDNLVGSYT